LKLCYTLFRHMYDSSKTEVEDDSVEISVPTVKAVCMSLNDCVQTFIVYVTGLHGVLFGIKKKLDKRKENK